METIPIRRQQGLLVQNNDITDRLTITSDNHPKPTDYGTEREPGGGPLVDQTFNVNLCIVVVKMFLVQMKDLPS